MTTKVTFRPTNFFNDRFVMPEVTGVQIEFGLVLHRGPYRPGWTVSEPFSGCAVAQGDTKERSLRDLWMRTLIVQRDHGIPFAEWLQMRRDEALRERGLFLVEHEGILVTATIPGSEVCDG